MGGDEGGGREKLVLSPSSGVDLYFRVLGSSGPNAQKLTVLLVEEHLHVEDRHSVIGGSLS